MVYIFLANGFEEIEALTQVDYLRRAGAAVKTVGVGDVNITGAHGITVFTDITEEQLIIDENIEMIILPGGIPGVPNLEKSSVVKNAVMYAFENHKLIGAICAAPTLLKKYGILEGKKATCYPAMSEQLGECYEKAAVIRDGNIITAEAAGSSEQFSFALIQALMSEEAAQKVSASIYAR